MKYTVEISIDLPREKVIELFDSTENLKQWQTGLVSFEPLSGNPGQVGAQSKLHYKIGKREIEMVETITKRELPDRFWGTYETKGVWNEVRNSFDATDENHTRWTAESEFKCSGLGMKLMCMLMPGAFKKQTLKYMKDFKAFAEKAAKEETATA